MSQAFDRDGRQRRLGYFSLSVIAHVVLLIVLMVGYFSRKSSDTAPARRTSPVAKASRAHRSTHAAAAPTEIIMADAKDPQAVEVPKEAEPVVIPAGDVAVAATPVPEATPEPVPAAKPIAKKVAHKAAPAKKLAKSKKAAAVVAEAPLPEKQSKQEDLAAEPYQPMSIKDVEPATNTAQPEELSPVISESIPAAEAAPADAVSAPVEAAPADAGSGGEAAAPAANQGDEASSGASLPGIVDASSRAPLRNNPVPSYPQRDRLLGHQGTATVTGQVDSTGAVSNVQLEQSSGSSSIDQASVDAFKKWKFAPGADATVRKSFAFSLNGEAQVARAQLSSR